MLCKMAVLRLLRKNYMHYGVLTTVFIVVLQFSLKSEKVVYTDTFMGAEGTLIPQHSSKQLKEHKRQILNFSRPINTINSATNSTSNNLGAFNLGISPSFTFMYGTTAVKVEGSIPSGCTFLFIGIHSGPSMKDRRRAIRETYLTLKPDGVAHAFILGNPTQELLRENARHKDMVFINQTERYTALDSVLPYKAATIIQLASRMDPQPYWLLKTDDDSFVNLPEVLKTVPTLEEDRFYGACYFKNRAIRNKSSKWYVSQAFWPSNKTYPPFCVGAGYFMSKKAYTCAANIFTKPTHKYFPREDVLNGMFMQACNINATKLPGVYNVRTNKIKTFLIKHYIKTTGKVKALWKSLHQNKITDNQSNKKYVNAPA